MPTPARQKIMAVFGTRPEAIKMAPVIRELRARPAEFETYVVFMGQHRELLESLIHLFSLAPDFSVDSMTHNQRLGTLTARLIDRMDAIAAEVQPHWILAQGDTVTVLAAAVVSHFNRCRFGHVEAGLRSHNFRHPFPEEFNRRVADVHCDAYFAPTEGACENLRREGAAEHSILLSGNTVVDALMWAQGLPFDWAKSPLATFAEMDKIVLLTAHRRENFIDAHREIFSALTNVAKSRPEWNFIYPVHLNPNVRRAALDYFQASPNIHLISPLDYLSFIHLMKAARFIVSDSGGVQEEAPTFGVPVLVIRAVTERPEAVTAGHNFLIGTSKENIEKSLINQMLTPPPPTKNTLTNPYGDGKAAGRIAGFIAQGARPR